ncbi:unnamed protein product, partial [Dovyalis caffra]
EHLNTKTTNKKIMNERSSFYPKSPGPAGTHVPELEPLGQECVRRSIKRLKPQLSQRIKRQTRYCWAIELIYTSQKCFGLLVKE